MILEPLVQLVVVELSHPHSWRYKNELLHTVGPKSGPFCKNHYRNRGQDSKIIILKDGIVTDSL